ncbi:ig-like domain-containing protein [Caerostris darwini]|uniref:Ig-like domain-containing protein n=1 Tax=Caerostris darwini TaxID=1538125 RepID=A0AAV4PTV3_9ARAC|nr:ig-like domain-containing protein [Caerostris darwini]
MFFSDIPELRLALGASIQHTAIKEGSDVYFDCNIRANPWVHDVSWRFEDNILFSNLSAGIIVSNQSLVLQRVKKEHRGRYQCVATNTEGEGRSEEVQLDVQFESSLGGFKRIQKLALIGACCLRGEVGST